MPTARVVYLFGNGLSLAFSKDYYSLPALTARISQRLSAMTLPDHSTLLEQLEAVGATIRAQSPPRDFEDIAGPIDSLASALSDLGPLIRLADTREQKAALTDLSRKLHRLYVQAVGAVLEVVVDHAAAKGDWNRVNAAAEDVVRQARETKSSVHVFVLNYDALLDSALLEAVRASRRVQMHDEFYGGETWTVTVPNAEGRPVQIPALPWRRGSFVLGEPHVCLHHLHGAGTWLLADQQVFKAKRLDRLREIGVFSAWAEGREDPHGRGLAEPLVLLGNQKERMVARWPFSETYQSFATAVATADELVLAGYSFRDRQLNQVVVQNRRPGCGVIVVNPSPSLDERAVGRELGLPKNNQDLQTIRQPLPEGLAARRRRRG